MKKVMVHPERCVGCMQCMMSCATAHSQSKSLFTAISEKPLPKPRVHVGAGRYGEGFPNRCRHCDPAPCLSARSDFPGSCNRHDSYQSGAMYQLRLLCNGMSVRRDPLSSGLFRAYRKSGCRQMR